MRRVPFTGLGPRRTRWPQSSVVVVAPTISRTAFGRIVIPTSGSGSIAQGPSAGEGRACAGSRTLGGSTTVPRRRPASRDASESPVASEYTPAEKISAAVPPSVAAKTRSAARLAPFAAIVRDSSTAFAALVVDGGGEKDFALQVPPDPFLTGLTVYSQWVEATSTTIALSNPTVLAIR